MLSCRHDSKRVYLVDSQRVITGKYTSSAFTHEIDPQELSIYRVNRQGERSQLTNTSIDNQEGIFSFHLADSQILNIDEYPLSHKLAAMGEPIFLIKNSGELSEKIIGFTTIEIRPTSLPIGEMIVPYRQFLLPITSKELLGASKTIPIVKHIELLPIGYTWVTVKDFESGQPLEGVNVMAIVDGTNNDEFGEMQAAWKIPRYHPVFSKTDAKGETAVLPLNPIGDDPRFQILGIADGYCLFVSPVLSFSENPNRVPREMLLRKCERQDKNIDVYPTFITENKKIFTEEINTNNLADVLYTNERSVTIRIDSLSSQMRGISYQLIEGWEDTENLSTPPTTLERFQSEITVELPIRLRSSGTENGKFMVKLYSDDLLSQGEPHYTYYLYGRKNVDMPSLQFIEDTKILSATGIENVISGIKDQRFFVTSRLCLDGEEIGLSIFGRPTIFQPCTESQAEFSSNDFSFSEEEVGGAFEIKLFLKNRYLNISDDDIEGSHKKKIHVDYGTPDLQAYPLSFQVRFGIRKKANLDSGIGSNAFPIQFPSGKNSDNDIDTVIIVPDRIDEFVIQFASPGDCYYQGASAKDGIQSGKEGYQISHFFIASNLEDAKNATAFSPCANDDKTENVSVGISLDQNSISFPSNPADKATFYFKIQDAAGHESEVYPYHIPPCSKDGDSFEEISICWRQE